MKQDIYCGTDKPIGSVELLDSMGDDNRIVDAARVSFAKQASQFTEKQNYNLLRYLWRNKHTGPFEQVVFYFRIKAPLFVARQWFRHRTARPNEISRRYVDAEPELYSPEMRARGSSNKQGSADELIQHAKAGTDLVDHLQTRALDTYQELLQLNVAPEVARGVLPMNMMTEFVWQMDLHNLLHFISLRIDDHAQKEIRVFAEALLDQARIVAPEACEVFMTYNNIDSVVLQLKNTDRFKKDPEAFLTALKLMLRKEM